MLEGHARYHGGYYEVWHAGGLAWSAGLRPEDVILEFAGRSISTDDDLLAAIAGRFSGDVVSVEIQRGSDTVTLPLPLSANPYMVNSPTNYRSDGFPTVIECDVPFTSFECGSPVVDRSGRAIGITIAHVGEHGGMVIPGDCVVRLLPALRSGKLANHWHEEE